MTQIRKPIVEFAADRVAVFARPGRTLPPVGENWNNTKRHLLDHLFSPNGSDPRITDPRVVLPEYDAGTTIQGQIDPDFIIPWVQSFKLPLDQSIVSFPLSKAAPILGDMSDIVFPALEKIVPLYLTLESRAATVGQAVMRSVYGLSDSARTFRVSPFDISHFDAILGPVLTPARTGQLDEIFAAICLQVLDSVGMIIRTEPEHRRVREVPARIVPAMMTPFLIAQRVLDQTEFAATSQSATEGSTPLLAANHFFLKWRATCDRIANALRDIEMFLRFTPAVFRARAARTHYMSAHVVSASEGIIRWNDWDQVWNLFPSAFSSETSEETLPGFGATKDLIYDVMTRGTVDNPIMLITPAEANAKNEYVDVRSETAAQFAALAVYPRLKAEGTAAALIHQTDYSFVVHRVKHAKSNYDSSRANRCVDAIHGLARAAARVAEEVVAPQLGIAEDVFVYANPAEKLLIAHALSLRTKVYAMNEDPEAGIFSFEFHRHPDAPPLAQNADGPLEPRVETNNLCDLIAYSALRPGAGGQDAWTLYDEFPGQVSTRPFTTPASGSVPVPAVPLDSRHVTVGIPEYETTKVLQTGAITYGAKRGDVLVTAQLGNMFGTSLDALTKLVLNMAIEWSARPLAAYTDYLAYRVTGSASPDLGAVISLRPERAHAFAGVAGDFLLLPEIKTALVLARTMAARQSAQTGITGVVAEPPLYTAGMVKDAIRVRRDLISRMVARLWHPQHSVVRLLQWPRAYLSNEQALNSLVWSLTSRIQAAGL